MSTCNLSNETHFDRLLDYCAGKLDAPSSVLLEQHMDTCEDCASFRVAHHQIWAALDTWDAPAVSADFNRNLYRKIDELQKAPWYSGWLEPVRALFSQPAIPLAAAGLVVAAGFLLDHPAGSPSVAPRAGISHFKVSVTEAEQVEHTLEDLEMLRQFDVTVDDGKENLSKSM